MEGSWKFIFICGSILLSARITHQAVNVALGGVANASSLWNDTLPADVAIDGKPDSDYEDGSCFSTQWDDNPWWRLDLQRSYVISSIEVIRRSDCCDSELHLAEIRIGDSLENNGNNNPSCAVILANNPITMAYSCSQMKGQYINIVIPEVGKRLQVCEVKVFTTTHIPEANMALGGVVVQSRVPRGTYQPYVAIDGKPYANYADKSCMSTGWQSNPWWRLDLRGPYIISAIEIVRRTDGSISELQGGEIRIGNSLVNNGNNNPRCAVITVTNDVNMAFKCNQMEGRYVNIFLRGWKRIIMLCEVRVYATSVHIAEANVAQNGVPTLSAAPSPASATPDMAIDGSQETCASTLLQTNPWWQLDLGTIYHITGVSVSIPKDCCLEDMNRAEIHIGLRSDTQNERCAVISTAEDLHTYTYQCGKMVGRFIHVALPGLQKNLTVCEVQVYGTVLENVAVRGVAFQSSLQDKTAFLASNVIDGLLDTCSITEAKPGQWVKVDLLVPYSVSVVQLAYQADCCYSNDVRVDNTRCTVSSYSEFMVTLDCGGIVGRYVTVMHPSVPLPLCEVEVFSTLENPENQAPQHPPPNEYCSVTSCSRDYIMIHGDPKTWSEAQDYCREKYTDLATINNPQDMNRAIDKMENAFFDFWIGIHEDNTTWRWSLSDEAYDGDDEAEFSNWGAGEPNETSLMQYCVGIQQTGEWKDLDCDLLHYFFCFDGKDGSPTTKILVKTPMKWADAQHYCREYHTDLISVRDLTENEEIQRMVPAGKLAWIGLYGDSWAWSDGSSSFRYWWQDAGKSLGEGPNCGYVHNSRWSIKSCDTKSEFLCYYYKKRTVMRIKTDVDMSDPDAQEQLLSQLEAQMKNKGISDFKIRWRKSFNQNKTAENPLLLGGGTMSAAVAGLKLPVCKGNFTGNVRK